MAYKWNFTKTKLGNYLYNQSKIPSSDLIIITTKDNKNISIHKCIIKRLTIISSYSELPNNISFDINFNIIKIIKKYLYFDKINFENEIIDNLLSDLYYAIDYFGIEDLLDEFHIWIKNNISKLEIFNLYSLCYTYNLNSLLENIYLFINENKIDETKIIDLQEQLFINLIINIEMPFKWIKIWINHQQNKQLFLQKILDNKYLILEIYGLKELWNEIIPLFEENNIKIRENTKLWDAIQFRINYNKYILYDETITKQKYNKILWLLELKEGQKIDICDRYNKWYNGVVLQINHNHNNIINYKILCIGWLAVKWFENYDFQNAIIFIDKEFSNTENWINLIQKGDLIEVAFLINNYIRYKWRESIIHDIIDDILIIYEISNNTYYKINKDSFCLCKYGTHSKMRINTNDYLLNLDDYSDLEYNVNGKILNENLEVTYNDLMIE